MGKFAVFKTVNAFSMNGKDWIYEGQVINLSTTEGEEFENAIVHGIIEEQNTLTLAIGNDFKYVNFDHISALEIVERRRINIAK